MKNNIKEWFADFWWGNGPIALLIGTTIIFIYLIFKFVFLPAYQEEQKAKELCLPYAQVGIVHDGNKNYSVCRDDSGFVVKEIK